MGGDDGGDDGGNDGGDGGGGDGGDGGNGDSGDDGGCGGGSRAAVIGRRDLSALSFPDTTENK